mgnify:FL=1|jgi:hypothetical protein
MTQPAADAPNWDAITPTVLQAWKETERRGAQLLFVIPFFGLPLLAAAYFAIPASAVPALVGLGMLVLSLAYVGVGRRRLLTQNVLWIRGGIVDKRIHQSTESSARQVGRRHYLTLEPREARALTRSGQFVVAEAPRGERATTTEIYDRVGVGDEVWAAVMPHDRAIYFVVAADGVLVGGDGAAADAEPASSQDSPKPPAT